MKNPKTALVYDDLYQKGGGEEFFLYICSLYPKADIYVPIVRKHFVEKFQPKADQPLAEKDRKVRKSSVLSFIAVRFGKIGYYFASFLSLFWFESLNLGNYDLVISVSNRFSHCVITPVSTKHISIINSPFRMLWEVEPRKNAKNSAEGRGRDTSFIIGVLLNFLRVHNCISAQRPDKLLSISSYVQSKIKKYWQRESSVLNPPLLKKNKWLQQKESSSTLKKDYFLLIGRLNKWKSPYFEQVLEKPDELGFSAVVVGSGPYLSYLKKKYKSIKFLGRVTDEHLYSLYSNCIALIHPQVEDFGLTPLEALFFEKPVIAYNKGGVLDYLNSKVAVFYDDEKGFVQAVQNIKSFKFDEKEAKNILKLHLSDNFKYNLNKIVEDALKQSA